MSHSVKLFVAAIVAGLVCGYVAKMYALIYHQFSSIEDVKWLEALEDRIDLEEARAALAESKKRARSLGTRSRKIYTSPAYPVVSAGNKR